jgi:hypothetical protein
MRKKTEGCVMTSSRCLKKAIIVTLVLVFFYKDSSAYLDPGTGSYILQITIGMLFGAAFAIKLFWNRIKIFFTRIFSKKEINNRNAKKEQR